MKKNISGYLYLANFVLRSLGLFSFKMEVIKKKGINQPFVILAHYEAGGLLGTFKIFLVLALSVQFSFINKATVSHLLKKTTQNDELKSKGNFLMFTRTVCKKECFDDFLFSHLSLH